MKKIALFYLLMISVVWSQEVKITENLRNYFNHSKNDEVKVWIYLTDKGSDNLKYFSNPEQVVSKKSLQRRAKVGGGNTWIDNYDLPINQNYITKLTEKGIKIHHRIKWFNAITAYLTKLQVEEIAKLDFVKKIDIVKLFKNKRDTEKSSSFQPQKTVPKGTLDLDYGFSYTQLQQINVPAVHQLGFSAQGVVVGVFDAGFNNLEHEAFNNMNIIASYDFVNNDNNVDDEDDMGEGSHGTETLSTIGGFANGELIGPAYGASFILAKTENTDSETPAEEDNWIAALEWADSIGVDVTSTSLGYIGMDFGYPGYTWEDMDGNTATITIGADLAVKRGIVVVNSAGNEGYDSHNTLGAPSDGDSVIAVGAVYSDGERTGFSSVGNTIDGRTKPDIMAMGSGVYVASPYSSTSYTSSSGTSFSCPLSAGVAALVVGANPNLTPMQVRDALRETADNSTSPNREYGWGILNALDAVNYFRVQISHSPLSDTEDPNRINEILADFSSNLGVEVSSLFVIFSSDNFQSKDSVQFTYVSGSTYSAILPSFENSTINYYLKGSSSSNIPSYLPTNAPNEFFSFSVSADTLKPEVSHTPISVVALSQFPIQIAVNATDNIGILSVVGYCSVNSGTVISFELNSTKNSNFVGTLPIESNQVSIGDLIQYRIVVTDVANIPNVVNLPENGNYEFEIGAFELISEDFELDNGNFTYDNEWQWGIPNATPGAHSGSTVWGTVLLENYSELTLSSLLTESYTVFGENPQLTFWHWYQIESGYDGGNVKMSVNNGAFEIITPVGGYDDEISTGWENPIGGEPAFTGETSTWKEGIFTLNNILNTGDIVQFRFDFGTDSSIEKLGWYLDDFNLVDIGKPYVENSDETEIPSKFALHQNYPNPFNPTTTIKFSIPNSLETQKIASLQVYNLLGQKVVELLNKPLTAGNYKVEFNASNLPSGIYFYKLQSGLFSETRKMVLIK